MLAPAPKTVVGHSVGDTASQPQAPTWATGLPVFGGTPAVSFARGRQPQAPAVAPGVEIIRVVRRVVGNYLEPASVSR